MRNRTFSRLWLQTLKMSCLVCPSAIVLTVLPGDARGQQVQTQTRISVNSAGVGGNASSSSMTLSPNANFFVFQSSANNLTTADTNSSSDIFVRDGPTGALSRISVGEGGKQADGSSSAPSITPRTANGFYGISYESDATNLVSSALNIPDVNDSTDVFYAFPSLGASERVSIGVGGKPANGNSHEPSMTVQALPDIGLVAFTSDAENLIAKDTNSRADIFLATVTPNGSAPATISIVRVSELSGGAVEANGDSRRPKISGDGNFVVYESDASNLTAAGNGLSSSSQIYLYSVIDKSMTLVSRSSSGQAGNADSSAPSISFSGSFIAYTTSATNIVSDGQIAKNSGLQVMRFDVKTGVTERVNVAATGVLSNGDNGNLTRASISSDGRDVFFSDAGSNLVANDTNNSSDVFVKDMFSSQVVRVSQPSSGVSADGVSFEPVTGAVGYTSLTIVGGYSSFASNIVSGDSEGRPDVFSSAIGLAAQSFVRGLTFETPPDVTFTPRRGLQVSLLPLTLTTANATHIFSQFERAAKKPELKLQYRVVLNRMVAGRLDTRRVNSTRNVVTFRRLPPGIYSVTYRAQSVSGDRIVSHTKMSAPLKLTVT